jgi:transcriptional regulator with XRE-family HTH domain
MESNMKTPTNGMANGCPKRPKYTRDQNFVHFLGPAVQIARLLRGFSQESLANALGERLDKEIRQTYISKIEKGACNVSWKRLAQFSDILQMSPIYILGIAVSLAEKNLNSDEILFRNALAQVAKRLSDKNSPLPPPVENVLKAVQEEIKRRLKPSSTQRPIETERKKDKTRLKRL